MSTKIVRTHLDDGVTVTAGLTDDGWLILLSDRIEDDSIEEHVAMASIRRCIAGWTFGFRPVEGGVDCVDMMPRVPGCIRPTLEVVP